jgi:hypothetical protein
MGRRQLGTPARFGGLGVFVMQLDLLAIFASPKYFPFELIPRCFSALLLLGSCQFVWTPVRL